jgi:hypothetical protein
MNRDEFEVRPKSDLIDLIFRQEAQIAELQAQVAQLQLAALKRNGDEQDATALVGEPVAPVGRFPAALRLIILIALALTCGITLIIANFRSASRVSAGRAQDYPPGSVTALNLPASDQADSMIPIFLVNDPAAGFLALYRQDTRSGCQVIWVESLRRFEEPCLASKYSQTGEYLSGPTARGLDRYPVSLTESGEVTVDVSRRLPGPARP